MKISKAMRQEMQRLRREAVFDEWKAEDHVRHIDELVLGVCGVGVIICVLLLVLFA